MAAVYSRVMSAEPVSLETARETGWRAELDLGFESRGGMTILAHRRHLGPLVVQRPFYPEGEVCHLYLIHPPGGIVGGDHLTARVTVAAGAHALLTTPAATKFYRSAGATAVQQQAIRVTGTCEWLPQESIYFSAARVRLQTKVQLDEGARFIGWETACCGRPASDEAFQSGAVLQTFELWRGNQPLLLDRVRIGGGEPMLQAHWGLAGFPVMGTLLAFPATESMLDAVRMASAYGIHADFRVAATLVDGALAIRAFGRKTDVVRIALMQLWGVLRPLLLGRPALAPRIWST